MEHGHKHVAFTVVEDAVAVDVDPDADCVDDEVDDGVVDVDDSVVAVVVTVVPIDCDVDDVGDVVFQFFNREPDKCRFQRG